MNAQDIRNSYLEFFKQRGHAVIPRALLVRQRNALLGFVGYNLIFGLTIPFIDLAAHAGGMAMGMIAGAALLRDPARPTDGLLRRVGGFVGIVALLAIGAMATEVRLERLPEVEVNPPDR